MQKPRLPYTRLPAGISLLVLGLNANVGLASDLPETVAPAHDFKLTYQYQLICC